MVWVTRCRSDEHSTHRPYFLINATQALEQAGSSLGSKQDANASFNNRSEPPFLCTSPFTPLHLHISSSSRAAQARGCLKPPRQRQWQSQQHDRDVQQRAEDKESPKTHLNTKDGLDERSLARTRVPLLSVLICPVRAACCPLGFRLSFAPVHVTVPRQSSSLVWSAPCVARSPSPAL